VDFPIKNGDLVDLPIENGYLVREFSHEKWWIFP